MAVEVNHSPPPLHEPHHSNIRPKGILKNPSFSGPSLGPIVAEQTNNEIANLPPSGNLGPIPEKDLTMQNTLQNAGHRRSSSAARRQSASRRQSSVAGVAEDDPNKVRLQWDEANLFLQEQEKGGRMKITEPKTPYQYGGAMDEEDDDDVAIDPRYVNVDEVDMAKNKSQKKARSSDIPGLDIGEPEDELAQEGRVENDRIIATGGGGLSRAGSTEKHASVSGEFVEQPGMPTREEQEKHRHFEEQRKRHYEMRDIKGLLGHPEDIEEEEEDSARSGMPALPDRGINGTL